jgi:hypothetical protein
MAISLFKKIVCTDSELGFLALSTFMPLLTQQPSLLA